MTEALFAANLRDLLERLESLHGDELVRALTQHVNLEDGRRIKMINWLVTRDLVDEVTVVLQRLRALEDDHDDGGPVPRPRLLAQVVADARWEYDDDPLILAAMHGKCEMMRVLLRFGARVNRGPAHVVSPLYVAVHHGHAACVRHLLELGADVEELMTGVPLIHAVNEGNVEMVRVLLDHVYQDDAALKSLLLRACKTGHNGIVKLLADRVGVLSSWPERVYTWPICCAAMMGHTSTVRLLLQYGGEQPVQSALFLAARAGQRVTVEDMAVCMDVDINCTDFQGRTPLMAAARTGNARLIRALVEIGADVHVRDTSGRSSLAYAARFGFVPAVEQLHELGASERGSDDRAVMEAASAGQLEALQALLSLGHSPDAVVPFPVWQYVRTYRGRSRRRPCHPWTTRRDQCALAWAVQSGQLGAVQVLLAAGARVDGSPRVSVVPPLVVAAQHAQHAIMRKLIQAGANVDAAHPVRHFTPLCAAVKCGDTKAFDMLVAAGADPCVVLPRVNRTLLHLLYHRRHAAASGSMLSLTHRLLKLGVNPHAADVEGRTAVDVWNRWPRPRSTDRLVSSYLEHWSQHRFVAFLLGTRSPDSSIQRFVRRTIFDKNVLSEVFALVDGEQHVVRYNNA